MNSANRTRHVFVFSRAEDLIELVRKATDATILVDSAGSEAEGLQKLAGIRPDIIIIGRLDSRESVLSLYRKLREGWISHHASLLIVEKNDSDETYRILGDENLTVSIGEYSFGATAPAPFLPVGPFIPLLSATIDRNLKARENRFKNAMMDPDKFCLVWEQIPGPGAFEMRQEMVLENARKAARSGQVCCHQHHR